MALEHKARGRKATGAKAAALRTRLSGERRDVKAAVALQLREAEKKLQSAYVMIDGWRGRAHEAEALLAELNLKATIPYTDEGNDLARRVQAHLKKYKTLSTPPDSR